MTCRWCGSPCQGRACKHCSKQRERDQRDEDYYLDWGEEDEDDE